MESSKIENRNCPVHGDYEGKFFLLADKWLGGHCPKCLQADKEREAAAKIQAEAQNHARRIEHLMQRSMIPARFKTRTLENYEAKNEGQAKAKEIASWYVTTWNERLSAGTSLIFSGNSGTGKTHLSTAIANAILAQGYSALFTTVSDAMRSIKRSYDKNSPITESEAIAALTTPNLLILDEVQMQVGSDHEKLLMFEIINSRYEQIKPTILLTNLGPQALKEFLGDRIMDRLREGSGRMVLFTWESNRA